MAGANAGGDGRVNGTWNGSGYTYIPYQTQTKHMHMRCYCTDRKNKHDAALNTLHSCRESAT